MRFINLRNASSRLVHSSVVKRIPRKLKPSLFRNSFIDESSPPQQLTTISSILSRKQKDRVFIVGGGSSLRNFNFQALREEDTICVNSSVFDVPHPNFFITKDYTFLINFLTPSLQSGNEAVKNWNSATKIFVACYASGALCDINGRIVDTLNEFVYDLSPIDWIIKNDKQKGISIYLDDFRCGIDSGYGALQLSILLGYQEIYLLGYDMCVQNKTHYHGRYNQRKLELFQKKLNGYFNLYRGGLRDIRKKTRTRIFSCSSISRFNEFIPYVDVNRVLQ